MLVGDYGRLLLILWCWVSAFVLLVRSWSIGVDGGFCWGGFASPFLCLLICFGLFFSISGFVPHSLKGVIVVAVLLQDSCGSVDFGFLLINWELIFLCGQFLQEHLGTICKMCLLVAIIWAMVFDWESYK